MGECGFFSCRSGFNHQLRSAWFLKQESFPANVCSLISFNTMTQFKFKTSEILQGDFKVANDLNLLLAFQVNCPGCFIYALPLAETLHNQYGNRLNVLGLSTAFEDFELNTVDHTKKLLDGGEVIGQTQKYLSQMGEVSYSSSISFPIAFDQVGKASEIFTPEDVDYLCGFVP